MIEGNDLMEKFCQSITCSYHLKMDGMLLVFAKLANIPYPVSHFQENNKMKIHQELKFIFYNTSDIP